MVQMIVLISLKTKRGRERERVSEREGEDAKGGK